jgi:hypothetical protein
MTDWLEETLDRDFGEAVPEGFASRVLARVQLGANHLDGGVAAPATSRILRFPKLIGLTAAAALLLSVGFWFGNGAKPVEPTLVEPGSLNMAALDLAELYSNRDVLQDFEILSAADLELAFQDEVASTWILDETIAAQATEKALGEEQ